MRKGIHHARLLKDLLVAVLLIVFASSALSCGIRRRALVRLAERACSFEDGTCSDLEDRFFNLRVRYTGIFRGDRFHDVVGFFVFRTEPHREGRIPVVMVHGYSAGPRPLQPIADSLDRERFEPWFTYYASGLELDRSAYLLRQALAQAAEEHGVDEVIVIGYSLGGLVARQALRPTEAGATIPSVPLFVAIAVPWGGSELEFLETERLFAPGVWEDFADGSWFLNHLFDDPLPPQTQMHVIYGLAERDVGFVPGPDDRRLSALSLSRVDALSEATTVMYLPHVDHQDVLRSSRTHDRVSELLDQIVPPAATGSQLATGP